MLLVCKHGPVINKDSVTEAVHTKQLRKHCSGVESAATRGLFLWLLLKCFNKGINSAGLRRSFF